MVGRGARFLAPIAIIAVAVGVYLIVHSTVDHHHQTPVTHSSSAAVKDRRSPRKAAPSKPEFYIVKAGDTLSAIAAKTRISVDELMSLNPSIAPNSLQTGQRLRLRR